MENEWLAASYRIFQHEGGKVLSAWVRGVVRGGFGVHETSRSWNVTHLRTGWSAFACATAYGAQIVAEYLIENYQADFDRLKIRGLAVENFLALENKVRADEKLWRLRRVHCITRTELKRRGNPEQPEFEIVS